MSAQRYRFGEATHRGPLGSVRAGQLALAVAGLIWAIAVIDLSPSARACVLALSGLAAAVLAATVPVAGRTLEQWLPVACAWLLVLRLRSGEGRVRISGRRHDNHTAAQRPAECPRPRALAAGGGARRADRGGAVSRRRARRDL